MPAIASNQRDFQSVQFQGLSDDQCRRLHWASLEILDRTGRDYTCRKR